MLSIFIRVYLKYAAAGDYQGTAIPMIHSAKTSFKIEMIDTETQDLQLFSNAYTCVQSYFQYKLFNKLINIS